MRSSDNIRNLPFLLLAVRPRTVPFLCYYAMCNVLYRATRIQICRAAVFRFRFGVFTITPNTGDLGTIGEIFAQRPYQAIPDFIPKEGDTCIDVGANIGCVSLQWRATNRSGTIVAVEPHPVTFKRMLANFNLNHLERIDCVQAAVADRDGEINIVIDNNANSMARVDGEHLRAIQAFDQQTTIRVPCMTIDTLIEARGITRVDLLKIDVEGFEVECLRGASKALTVTDKVVLEYHSADLRRDCTAVLTSAGFRCDIEGTLLFASKLIDIPFPFAR